MADIIEAVLEQDIPALRFAFDLLLTPHGSRLIDVAVEIHSALLTEVCAALLEDGERMDDGLCRRLGVPNGATFAQGAAKAVPSQTVATPRPFGFGPKEDGSR